MKKFLINCIRWLFEVDDGFGERDVVINYPRADRLTKAQMAKVAEEAARRTMIRHGN